jgi:hypothetical protein
MTDRFHHIGTELAKTLLERGSCGGLSEHEIKLFTKGYNYAVDRLNVWCEKGCNKTCGYCGTENHGKNDKCINCLIKF